MALPSTLNPFPNPVGAQSQGVIAMMARGNDNLLAENINAINAYVAGLKTLTYATANVVPGGPAQNILNPGVNSEAVLCWVTGRNATPDAFVDCVALHTIPGWAPAVPWGVATIGAPGARTYANAVGQLSLAIAGAGPAYSIVLAYVVIS